MLNPTVTVSPRPLLCVAVEGGGSQLGAQLVVFLRVFCYYHYYLGGVVCDSVRVLLLLWWWSFLPRGLNSYTRSSVGPIKWMSPEVRPAALVHGVHGVHFVVGDAGVSGFSVFA